MRKNKIVKIMAAVLSVAFMLSGMTALAFSAEPEATASTETVIEDNRTLTPKGNADLLDDVSDSEDLQFITVTARDGNVFYFVIDHAAESENVYFLNVVDESDLAALTEDADTKTEEKPVTAEPAETEPTEPEQQEQEKTEQPEKDTGGNAGFLVIILLLACAVGAGAYYYKVVLPKKKLEQADDLEDFEFEEYDEDDTEDTEYEETDDEEETEE